MSEGTSPYDGLAYAPAVLPANVPEARMGGTDEAGVCGTNTYSHSPWSSRESQNPWLEMMDGFKESARKMRGACFVDAQD